MGDGRGIAILYQAIIKISSLGVGYTGSWKMISNETKQYYARLHMSCIPVEHHLKLLGQKGTLDWFASLLYIQFKTVNNFSLERTKSIYVPQKRI